MKNRYGDEYYWERLNEKEYKFNMTGTSMNYCRFGARDTGPIDHNDLGMFDPSGGPYVAVGSKIYWDEVLGGVEVNKPLIVERIRSTDDGLFVEVSIGTL